MSEEARTLQGIDGTMGDAQDIAHYYVRSDDNTWCVVCGLAKGYKKHINIDSILSCGTCYTEDGEEVHPYPECTLI